MRPQSNTKACHAPPWDILQGDQLGNTTKYDLGKIQFLATTLLALGVYACSVGQDFLAGSATTSSIPEEIATLSVASATGYALSKLGISN